MPEPSERELKEADIIRIYDQKYLNKIPYRGSLPVWIAAFPDGTDDQDRFTLLAGLMRLESTFVLAVGEAPKQLGLGEQDMALVPELLQEQRYRLYTGELDDYPLMIRFLRENTPAIKQLNINNFQKFKDTGKPMVYLLVRPQDDSASKLVQELEPLGKRLEADFIFVWLDMSGEWESLAKSYGLPAMGKYPRVALEVEVPGRGSSLGGVKYWYPDDRNPNKAELHEWLKSCMNGRAM